MSTRLFKDQEVLDIRERILRGDPTRRIAEAYETTLETIRRIGRGDTYRHLGLGKLGQTELISDEQITTSLDKFLGGLKAEEIAPPIVKTATSPDEVDRAKLVGYLGEERTDELRGNLFDQ